MGESFCHFKEDCFTAGTDSDREGDSSSREWSVCYFISDSPEAGALCDKCTASRLVGPGKGYPQRNGIFPWRDFVVLQGGLVRYCLGRAIQCGFGAILSAYLHSFFAPWDNAQLCQWHCIAGPIETLMATREETRQPPRPHETRRGVRICLPRI